MLTFRSFLAYSVKAEECCRRIKAVLIWRIIRRDKICALLSVAKIYGQDSRSCAISDYGYLIFNDLFLWVMVDQGIFLREWLMLENEAMIIAV